MKSRSIILTLFLFITLDILSQNATGAGGNTIDGSYEMYRSMSPGSTSGNRRVFFKLRDSIYVYFHQDSVAFKCLSGSGDRLVTVTPSGRLRNIPYSMFATSTDLNDYLLLSDTTNKWQKKGSYLITETDPTVPAYSKSLSAFSVIKLSTDGLYEPLFSKNTAFNKNFGLISGTIVEGNDSRILNGQTAFGWGNHASVGYATASSFTLFTNKTGNISQWTNNAGYVVGNGSASEYIKGDGTKGTYAAGVIYTAGQNTKIVGNVISDSTTTRFYNGSGRVNQNVKIWSANVSPSTANGYSIDISSAGFSTILSVSVIAVRNTASPSASPNVSIKTKSNSTLVVNVVEDNTATQGVLLNLLGGLINVLAGAPSVFANTAGLTLDVTVIGY